MDVFGTILFSELKNLKNNDQNFKKIENNLNNIKVRDFIFHNNNIYVSAIKLENKCNKIKIFKSKIDYVKLNFEEIFSSRDCDKNYNIQAGRITIIENEQEKFILLSTNADETYFSDDKKYISLAQNSKSIFGKTLLINLKTYDYKIFLWVTEIFWVFILMIKLKLF